MTSTCLKRPLTLGLLALCGLSCGLDFVSVGVTVKNLTPDISSLYVYGQIDGRFETEGNEFTQQLGHFTLQVPVAAIGAGQFTINAAGRANDRCKLSAGRVDTHISRDVAYREAEMNLVLLPSKLCTQLTTVTPALAPTEKPITLTLDGQNFAEGTTVTVAGVKATSIQVSSSTRLTATIPAASGTYGNAPVVVLTPDGQSTTRSDLFGYYASLSFSATDFPVSMQPYSVAMADYNGDRMIDLAVGSIGSGTGLLSVLLGTGAGAFDQPTTVTLGLQPVSMVTADFNLDLKPDLAITDYVDNVVRILLGTGKGGFGSPTSFAVTTGPHSVKVGDFNLDQKPDLAVANYTSGTVGVLLGTGTGGMGSVTNTSVGSNPISIAVGDFNRDQKPDVVTANSMGHNVSVLLSNGIGSLGAATYIPTDSRATPRPYSVAAADFNGDQKLDIAVANYQSGTVGMLLGDGMGNFGTATTVPVGSLLYALAVADFNGDQKLDIAVANAGNNTVGVLLGDGAGGFLGQAIEFPAGKRPVSVTVSDVNQDQKPDLVAANFEGGSVTILINTSR